MASQTHGYREFVRIAAWTGKAITELDGTDLAAARAEVLGACGYEKQALAGSLGDARLGTIAAWPMTKISPLVSGT